MPIDDIDLSTGEVLRWFQRLDKGQSEFRAEVNSRLDKVATLEALAAEQRLVNQRLETVNSEIADVKAEFTLALTGEKTEREKSVSRVRQDLEETEKKRVSNYRFMVSTLLTAAAVIIGLLGIILTRGAA